MDKAELMPAPDVPRWQRVGLDFLDEELATIYRPKGEYFDDTDRMLMLYGYVLKRRYSDGSDRDLEQLRIFGDENAAELIRICCENGEFSVLHDVGIGFFTEDGKPHFLSDLDDTSRMDLATQIKQHLYVRGKLKRGRSQTPSRLCFWVLAILKQAHRNRNLTEVILEFFSPDGVFDHWFYTRYGLDSSRLPFHFPTKIRVTEPSRFTNFKSRMKENAERALEATARARGETRDAETIAAQEILTEWLRQELFESPEVFRLTSPSTAQRERGGRTLTELFPVAPIKLQGSKELFG